MAAFRWLRRRLKFFRPRRQRRARSSTFAKPLVREKDTDVFPTFHQECRNLCSSQDLEPPGHAQSTRVSDSCTSSCTSSVGTAFMKMEGQCREQQQLNQPRQDSEQVLCPASELSTRTDYNPNCSSPPYTSQSDICSYSHLLNEPDKSVGERPQPYSEEKMQHCIERDQEAKRSEVFHFMPKSINKAKPTLSRMKDSTNFVSEKDEDDVENCAAVQQLHLQTKPFPHLLIEVTEPKETDYISDQKRQRQGPCYMPIGNSQKEDTYASGATQISFKSEAESTQTTIKDPSNDLHQRYHSQKKVFIATTESQNDNDGKSELVVGRVLTFSSSFDDSYECSILSAPATIPRVRSIIPATKASKSTPFRSTQHEPEMIHSLQENCCQQSTPAIDLHRSVFHSSLRLDHEFGLQSQDKRIILHTKPLQREMAVKYLSQKMTQDEENSPNPNSNDKAAVLKFFQQNISAFYQDGEEESSTASPSTFNLKQQSSFTIECLFVPELPIEDQITLTVTIHPLNADTTPNAGVVCVSGQFLHNNNTVAPCVHRHNFALEIFPQWCQLLITANSRTIPVLPLSVEHNDIYTFRNLFFCQSNTSYPTADSDVTNLKSSVSHSPPLKVMRSIDTSEASFAKKSISISKETLQDTFQKHVGKNFLQSKQMSTVCPHPLLMSNLFQKHPSLDLRTIPKIVSSPDSHERKDSKKDGNERGQDKSGNNDSSSRGGDRGGGDSNTSPSNSGSGGNDDNNGGNKRNRERDGKKRDSDQQEEKKKIKEDEDDMPSASKESDWQSKQDTSEQQHDVHLVKGYLQQKPEQKGEVNRRLDYHGTDTREEDEEQNVPGDTCGIIEEEQPIVHAQNSNESMRPDGCMQEIPASTSSPCQDDTSNLLHSTDLGLSLTNSQPNPSPKSTVVNSVNEIESREQEHIHTDDEDDKGTPKCKTEDEASHSSVVAHSSTRSSTNKENSIQQHNVSSNVHPGNAINDVLADPNSGKQGAEASNCPIHPKEMSLRVQSKALVAFRNQASMTNSFSMINSGILEPQQQCSSQDEEATVNQQSPEMSQKNSRHSAESNQPRSTSPRPSTHVSFSHDLQTPVQKENNITKRSPVPSKEDRSFEVLEVQEANFVPIDVLPEVVSVPQGLSIGQHQEHLSTVTASNVDKPVHNLPTTQPRERSNIKETSPIQERQDECSEVIRPLEGDQETTHEATATDPLDSSRNSGIKQKNVNSLFISRDEGSADDPPPKKQQHTAVPEDSLMPNGGSEGGHSEALCSHGMAQQGDNPVLLPNDQPVNELQAHMPKETEHVTEQSPILEEWSQEPLTEDHAVGETTTAAESSEPLQSLSASHSLEEHQGGRPDIPYTPPGSEDSVDGTIPKEKRHISEYSPVLEEYSQDGQSEDIGPPPVNQVQGRQLGSSIDEEPLPHLQRKSLIQGKITGNQALEHVISDTAATESPAKSLGMGQNEDGHISYTSHNSGNVKRHITEQSPIVEENKGACSEAQTVGQLESSKVSQHQNDHSPDIPYTPPGSEDSVDDTIPKEKRHISEYSPVLGEYSQDGQSEGIENKGASSEAQTVGQLGSSKVSQSQDKGEINTDVVMNTNVMPTTCPLPLLKTEQDKRDGLQSSEKPFHRGFENEMEENKVDDDDAQNMFPDYAQQLHSSLVPVQNEDTAHCTYAGATAHVMPQVTACSSVLKCQHVSYGNCCEPGITTPIQEAPVMTRLRCEMLQNGIRPVYGCQNLCGFPLVVYLKQCVKQGHSSLVANTLFLMVMCFTICHSWNTPFLLDCDAISVKVETCELVIDAAKCIDSTEGSTSYPEVFIGKLGILVRELLFEIKHLSQGIETGPTEDLLLCALTILNKYYPGRNVKIITECLLSELKHHI